MSDLVLVPREPTEAMLDAAAATPGIKRLDNMAAIHQLRTRDFRTVDFGSGSSGRSLDWDDGSPLEQAWRAMLDAAPPQAAVKRTQPGKPYDEPTGDWQQTFTGLHFYPGDPRPDQICIEDIARALSKLCRFAGHCEHFYSVAQHSVYVSAFVPIEHQFAALMHDATEAYIVDVPRPLKRMLPDYVEIEHNVWRAIAKRFGLPEELPQCVKDADNRVLLREKEVLLKASASWAIPGTPAPVDIRYMQDTAAYEFFMGRFNFLQDHRNA